MVAGRASKAAEETLKGNRRGLKVERASERAGRDLMRPWIEGAGRDSGRGGEIKDGPGPVMVSNTLHPAIDVEGVLSAVWPVIVHEITGRKSPLV